MKIERNKLRSFHQALAIMWNLGKLQVFLLLLAVAQLRWKLPVWIQAPSDAEAASVDE